MANGGNLFLGIDLGGSSVKYGWGSTQKGLLFFGRLELLESSYDNIHILVKKIITDAEKSIGLDNLSFICIGTPGTINRKTGKITGINPNLTNWTDIDPLSILPVELQRRACAGNDANLMALGEAYYHPDFEYILGITIGSGLGCGFVFNKEIYLGSNGYAMELGHNIVKQNGERCNCGKKGCLEAYVSVNGMLNRIRQSESKLALNCIDDILALSNSNSIVSEVLENSICILSQAVANLIINLDVDAVIFGGGVIENNMYPFLRLKSEIIGFLPELHKHKIIIEKAKLGNKAGVWGAILQSERHFNLIKE